jgi:hypothetical protein
MMKITFEDYIFTVNDDIEYCTFDEKSYHGITFYVDGNQYELIRGVMGDRLVISHKDGSWKDVPFHEGTWGFLPEEIQIRRK